MATADGLSQVDRSMLPPSKEVAEVSLQTSTPEPERASTAEAMLQTSKVVAPEEVTGGSAAGAPILST